MLLSPAKILNISELSLNAYRENTLQAKSFTVPIPVFTYYMYICNKISFASAI